MSTLSDFELVVRSTLHERLQLRDPAQRYALMGAGTESLDAACAFLRRMADTGFMVPTWPTKYGGLGLTSAHASIIRRAFAAFEIPELYPFGVGLGIVGPTLLEFGTDEQKSRLLPGIIHGEHVWCQLLSEPNAGSDLAGVATRAVRDGGVWRITGNKVWSSRAQYGDYGFCLARTDSSQPKHAGLTMFAVHLKQPGVTVRPLRQINGDEHFNEVFLDEVIVDDADRVGEPGSGWRVAMCSLGHERRGLNVSPAVGVADAWADLLELARERGMNTDPVVRQQLASVFSLASVNRWTARRSQHARRVGRRAGLEGSAAKLRAVELQKAIADLAMNLLGVESVATESAWQTRFLTAPSLSIRGGTDEVQRNIVGEQALGLPSEPRIDTHLPFSQLHLSAGTR